MRRLRRLYEKEENVRDRLVPDGSDKYISCVSCVMRAITGFITTHLPSVAAPAPLIHNLKRSQTNLQGGLYTYRIHLAPGVIK